jgi:hypothetical protein
MKNIITLLLLVCLAQVAFTQEVAPFTIKGDTLEIQFQKFTYKGQVLYSDEYTISFPSRNGKELDVISYTLYSMCDQTSIIIKRSKGVAIGLRVFNGLFFTKSIQHAKEF